MPSRSLKPLPPEFPVPREISGVLSPRRGTSFFEKFCRFSRRVLGRLVSGYRLSPRTEEKLKEAGISVSGEEWLSGFILALILPGLPFFIAWIFEPSLTDSLYMPVLGLLVGSLSAFVFQVYPEAKAASNMARAQADVVSAISVLSFSLYHKPDLRGAVARAADATEGELSKDLRLGLLQLSQHGKYESVRHLLTDLAEKWGRKNESVRQAFFDVLRSSGASEESSRVSDLMRAPSRILESSEEQLSVKLNSLVLPTIAFLTFGSILIVVTVGLSPVFGIVNPSLLDLRFFIGTVLVIVAVFLVFSLYMVSCRPPILLPAILVRDREGLTCSLSRASVLLPLVVFILLSLPGFLYVAGYRTGHIGFLTMSLSTLWIVLAAGVSVGMYGHLRYSPLLTVRESERRRVADWENALNFIGSRMLDGKSAGRAMLEASGQFSGELSQDLRAAGERMERSGMDMEGAMNKKENPLIQSFISQISRLRGESEFAAGRACMVAAEFLHMLRKTEERFRKRMNEVLGNLWMVSLVLIPVVCAMSVWIIEFMSGMRHAQMSQTSMAGLSTFPFMVGALEKSELAILRLVMGLAAIALSAVIGWFISNIRSPGDKVEMWLNISKSSLISSLIFTLATSLLLFMVPGGSIF